MAMKTIEEIEHAITHLSAEDLAAFRAWFVQFDAQIWDEQFEKDVSAGSLDALAEEALRHLNDGHCTDL
jgi:hypothetical protein